MKQKPQVGTLRAIALWGGRGGQHMMQVRHPRLAADEDALRLPFSEAGVARAAAMGVNHVFVMVSWALPPEEEEADWALFHHAVGLYHTAGIQVSAGLEVSSYAVSGSYREKDWAAHDSRGRPIPSDVGRFYACWNAPEWVEAIEQRVRRVADAAADGVFFYAPRIGSVPVMVGGGLMGVVGCHDSRCQEAFAAAHDGAEIPVRLAAGRPQAQAYLAWRADLLRSRLQGWADAARARRPDIVVTVLGPDPAGSDPFLRFGTDAGAFCAAADWSLVEVPLTGDPAGAGAVHGAGRIGLAHAADAGRSVAALIRSALPSSTDQEAARAIVTAVAEASAMGAPAVVEGMMHHSPDQSSDAITQLLADDMHVLPDNLREMYGWLEQHANWLGQAQAVGPLAVLYPAEAFRSNWRLSAPVFWSVCATLIQRGMPFRVVGDGEWNGVEAVVVPPGPLGDYEGRLTAFVEQGGRVITVQQARPWSTGRPLWTGYHPLRLHWQQWPLIRRLVHGWMIRRYRWYFTRSAYRFLANRLGRGGFTEQHPAFELPPAGLQDALIEAVGDVLPRAQSAAPVLLTIWQNQQGEQLWHLVNYAGDQQRVSLRAARFVNASVYSPDDAQVGHVFGNRLIVNVNRYKVLRVRPQTASQGEAIE